MAEAQRTVKSAELQLLKELGEYLGDRINNPLAVILGSAQLLEMRDHSMPPAKPPNASARR